MNKLKSFMKSKIDENLKNKIYNANFNFAFKFFKLSIFFNTMFSIIYGLNKSMNSYTDMANNYYISLNDFSHSIPFFVFSSFSSFIIMSFMYKKEKNLIKKYFNEEDYNKILDIEEVKKEFENKKMTLEEIECFFKTIEQNSHMSRDELGLIIRNIENKEGLEIGNTYYMLKIMSEVVRQEDLKINVDMNDKIRKQMKFFMKEKVIF